MVLFLELGGELQLKPAFSGTYLYKYTCTHIYIYMYILGKCIHTDMHSYTKMHMHTHSYVYGITRNIKNIYTILEGFFL